MKHSFKRALSLVLMLAMVLSLGVLPASASDIEIVDVTEPAQEVDEVNYPAQQFSYYEPNGLCVDVKAPAGALPRGTTMEVSRLTDLNRVQNAVDRAEDLDGKVALAADITFRNGDEEVEPLEGSKILVTMTAPEIAELSNPVVVHVPDEEPAVAEKVDPLPEEEDALRMGDQVAFEASSFSVYAIIGDPEHEYSARVTINFYKNKGDATPIATMYVKEADTAAEVDEIVYDPGVPELSGNTLFQGWCRLDGENDAITLQTEAMSIEKVREQIVAMNITEDITVNYYAVIYKYFNVSYYADGLCYGSKTVLLLLNQETAPYTVSMLYTAGTEQDFKGWKVSDGLDHIVSGTLADDNHTQVSAPVPSTTVFPNDSVIEISGDVKFDVEAPAGHWLVFHENPDSNHSGATYIAPQFLRENENSVDPQAGEAGIPMKCPGYTFDGWYLGTTDGEGNFTGYTTKFTFGSPITSTTHLYAKWSDATSAFYTVIIWKENIDGDGWDFAESRQITGQTPGASITYNQNSWSQTGFEFKEYDTGKTVKADSSTVVNVYYQRKTFTLTFRTSSTGAIEYKTISGYELASQSGNYYIKINGNWYQFRNEGYYVWNATSIDSTPTAGQYITYTWNGRRYSDARTYTTTSTLTDSGLVKTITAKYEQKISDYFPIVGTNGTTYTGGRWTPGTNSQGWSEVMSYIDIMPGENITFTLDTSSRPTKVVNYYIETDDGTVNGPGTLYTGTSNTVVSASGKKFTLYKSVEMKYNGVTEEDIVELNGYSRLGADKQGAYQTVTGGGQVFFYVWNTTSGSTETISFYYVRKEYKITYFEGGYFGGKNGTTPMTVVQPDNYGESSLIYFNSDISAYGDKEHTVTNPATAGYYTPTPKVDGYLFAGWYVDDSCSQEYDFDKMPLEGVTVYAKWVQSRYRVFLHPNVPESDLSLNWGSADQEMNFGVAWGDKISAPFGTRDGYTFLGWTRADGSAFNASFIELTDDTVPAEPVYDKTVDFTDTMNKYGNIVGTGSNSDANRFFVVRKLDLYGKWRKDTPGADGIFVAYDLNGGTGNVSDTSLYPDNTDAVAQTAPATAPDAADGSEQHFLYWVVQTWDNSKGEYVDAVGTDGKSIFVSPGSTFTVLLDNAKKEEKWLTDDNGNYVLDDNDNKIQETKTDEHGNVIPQWIYTVQLRAEYGPLDTPTPTHIYWYANNGTDEVQKDENVQINVGVDIPTTANYNPGTRATGLSYPGHVFIGWARLESDYTGDTSELGFNDLFLRWSPDENDPSGNGGYYLAQDEHGDWVPVTQVACDEKNPYHDLYAVWGSAFYVYHSSTKQVERILVSGTAPTVDLTALVDTSKYLYGGYYSVYGDASASFVSDPETLAWTRVENIASYSSTSQINTWAAEGMISVAVDKNGTAYTGQADVWASSKAYTAAGNSVTPVSGTVYYIKEVPADTFLQPRLKFTYKASNGEIGSSWLITNMDDTNYADVGFMVGSTKAVGAKVDSITITALNTQTTETYSVTDIFPGGAKMSYKMVYNNPDLYPENYEDGEDACNILTNGARVHMFWVTPDGMMVTSTAVRTYNNVTKASGYSGGMTGAKTTQTSTITLYSAS